MKCFLKLKSLLIIQYGSRIDSLYTVPVIQAIKKQSPGLKIIVFTDIASAPIFTLFEQVKRVIIQGRVSEKELQKYGCKKEHGILNLTVGNGCKKWGKKTGFSWQVKRKKASFGYKNHVFFDYVKAVQGLLPAQSVHPLPISCLPICVKAVEKQLAKTVNPKKKRVFLQVSAPGFSLSIEQVNCFLEGVGTQVSVILYDPLNCMEHGLAYHSDLFYCGPNVSQSDLFALLYVAHSFVGPLSELAHASGLFYQPALYITNARSAYDANLFLFNPKQGYISYDALNKQPEALLTRYHAFQGKCGLEVGLAMQEKASLYLNYTQKVVYLVQSMQELQEEADKINAFQQLGMQLYPFLLKRNSLYSHVKCLWFMYKKKIFRVQYKGSAPLFLEGMWRLFRPFSQSLYYAGISVSFFDIPEAYLLPIHENL